MFQTRIQTLRVLTNDDQIELRITTRHIRQRTHRTQVRIKIQRLAQSDIDRSKTFSNRRRDRTFERHLVTLNRIEQLLREGFTELFERLRARVMRLPLNLN